MLLYCCLCDPGEKLESKIINNEIKLTFINLVNACNSPNSTLYAIIHLSQRELINGFKNVNAAQHQNQD